tara:strand:- start:300 stop:491 length:192 start_codon:yes stop_codon:yes gene_type:complete
MISSITPNLILYKITHHPIDRKRTFFLNSLWGTRLGTSLKNKISLDVYNVAELLNQQSPITFK